jgi:predicted phosphodiesterase
VTGKPLLQRSSKRGGGIGRGDHVRQDRPRWPVSRLALISDIHGNAVALEAVLADLARQGVAEIVCLGDVAAGGPQPRAVIARLRELQCPVVRGNADSWLLEGLPPGRSAETRRLAELVTWARTQLAQADLDYLGAFARTLTVAVGGVRLFCFHGSPDADVDALLATTPEGQLDDLFATAPAANMLAGGHTHLQLLRCYGERLLLNPGSVGLPLGASASADAPLPAWGEYALVTVSGGGVEVAFRRVASDLPALAAATEAMPHATWAVDLERRILRWNARA